MRSPAGWSSVRRHPRWWIAGAAVVALAAAGTVYGVLAVDRVVTLSEKDCGNGWSGPVDGRQSLVLRDAAPNPVQVYLIDPRRNLVYAEARDLTPGTRRTMSTTLGAGRYALRCVFTDGTVLTSQAHTLTGTVAGAVTGVPPMPDLDLTGPVGAYRSSVERGLPPLLADATRLAADVAAGNLAAARTDWLPAHLDYERLGAAYNSFQDFDGAINGTADGLPDGVDDQSWTGLHRIEYGLWHGQPAAVLRPLTGRLVSDIKGLIEDLPSEDIDPGDLPLRTHEILENTLQFQVTGHDDYGSGTTLATAYANTQGTQAVLGTLTGLISARDPALLAAIDRGIATVQADLLACRVSDQSGSARLAPRHDPDQSSGIWIAAGALPQARRQKVDADLGALLEQLDAVPNLLHERTSA
ncbi:EfeM/EfeO family lipoprotein [Rugosimonospora africana]|uniref:Iron transporter n=1 Tax=Rugosimonospora africana TaxID=556532 RepID=A0A8J3QXK1_9ACTN|nr:EfeM/EfeO family lipoprotein [Rugosimonospora africana]GIH17977.1 iron transporter [Rugosimonospora africana]